MESSELSDSPVPFGPVAGEQHWLASEWTLAGVWVLISAPLLIPQVMWWPVAFNDRISWLLVTLTLAVTTVPLLAYLWLRQASVYRRWATAHDFRFDPKPTWPLPNFGIAPFNTADADDWEVTDALDGEVNGCAALYLHSRGAATSTSYRYVFALQMSGRLPHMTLTTQLATDRDDGVGYIAPEPVRPFYRYGTDPDTVAAVFHTRALDAVMFALPKRVREDIRFDTAGEFLIAATPQGFRAEHITAVFVAMHAIATAVPLTAWIPD